MAPAIQQKIVNNILQHKNTAVEPVKNKQSFNLIHYIKPAWIAAASVLALICGIYFLKSKEQKSVALNGLKTASQYDIIPGKNKAVLTLSDGSRINLDSTSKQTITHEMHAAILQQQGTITYHSNNTAPDGKQLYNTITVPNGGQYQVTLSDGSKVWLNAASSLRYPVSFTGSQREVTLTGEAYFEIAKDKTRPFHVAVNTINIEVLGTHFDVNAYADENATKTTLLEGAVKITAGNQHALLRPGQQAQLHQKALTVSDHADTDEAVAWKNGYFQFDHASLETIMHQFARWYDVSISYEGIIEQRKFVGKISRNTNASEALKILELSGVHFKIDGKKIIILP